MRPFLIGLQFLTRIQLFRQTDWTESDFGKSVSWFSVIGIVIGAVLALINFCMEPLDVPYLTAFLLVSGEFLVTGAMHADGLMDTCDGLFSGRSRERILEIMKDSCVGSFGLLAFVFLVLLKTFCLAEAGESLYVLLIAMPVIGRLNMVISICEYPYARPYGILAGIGLLAGFAVNQWVMRKIGGTTGDTYGCTTEISELVMAAAFVILCRGNLWFM